MLRWFHVRLWAGLSILGLLLLAGGALQPGPPRGATTQRVYLPLVAANGALNAPLTVVEPAGVDRVNDPVTAGIPLPRSAGITDTATLWLADAADAAVPAQFTVLARWAGAPGDAA